MAQDMDNLWKLFALGSATSEGYKQQIAGSGRVFAYGYRGPGTNFEMYPGTVITTWNGEKRTVEPATKESVASALDEMGITETAWGL